MQLAADALDISLTAPPASWAGLDEPAQWRAFSRPADGPGGCWESYLAIEGMHCAGCSLAVEQALGASRGVHMVQVNGATATARIVWTPSAGKPSDWLAALDRAGYSALPAGDLLAAAPRAQARRMLLWRWLVAGFCMMQVMMYAAPAYLAPPGEITPDIEALLRWASLILTLPVVLFSCRPFMESAWRDLTHLRLGMDVPVTLGILIAFGASSVATFEPAGLLGREVWFDSITMFVFFLLSGRLLEQRLRDRTAGSLEALMRRMPDSVERQSPNGNFVRVPVSGLAMGDLIRVLPGDAFPADGIVISGESRVDEALLTGESRPLPRSAGEPVVAGSHNLSGPMVVRIERVGADTRFAGIVALMERASVDKPRLARIADRIAGPFLLCVLIASAGAAAWWWSAGPAHAIGIAVAVLIVTCPCALSLATPAATLAAAGALARRGVLVRRLGAFETLASIDTVIFDKTGTLTESSVKVVGTECRAGIDAAQALAMAAALAQHSLHPASRAIVNAAGHTPCTATRVSETPGQGIEGQVPGDGGEPRTLRIGSAAFCGVPHTGDAASSHVYLADEAGWLARFDLDEALRGDAKPAVAALQRLDLPVKLLSGDQTLAVERLARRAGIALSLGEQSPEEKLEHVRRLQQAGHRVAM
ncbi:MAG: cation-translocating P-type ATPase, partial [Ramlibacter sp.]